VGHRTRGESYMWFSGDNEWLGTDGIRGSRTTFHVWTVTSESGIRQKGGGENSYRGETRQGVVVAGSGNAVGTRNLRINCTNPRGISIDDRSVSRPRKRRLWSRG